MPTARLWIIPAVVLGVVSLITTMFTFAPAQAQTVSGDYCIEGLVIDWEEDPLPGITVHLLDSMGNELDTRVSAEDPDDKDEDIQEGEFEFDPITPSAPDEYTVYVDVPPDWEGVTPTSITFEIEAGRDGCVKIRFKLRPLIYVQVVKIDSDHFLLPDWRIEARPGPGNFFAEVEEETTNISGTAFFTLTPGSWIFVEREPDTDDKYDDKPDPYMPVVPPGGQQTLDLEIEDVGYTYTIVFKNEFKNNGCIVVQKFGLIDGTEEQPGDTATPFAAPTNEQTRQLGYGAGGWGFKLLKKNGEVYKQGITDATGVLRFEWLPYGPYTIVEEDRVGWDEVSDRFVDVTVDSGDCIYVPFENEQNDIGFCIEGYKTDLNGGYGIADWEIKIKPLEDGGYDPPNAFTDGLGKFRFEFPDNDYRVPGATYEICEDDDVDGWKPSSNPCRRVTLPEWPMAQCAQLEPFVNEQIGHKEDTHFDEKHDGDNHDGKDGHDGYGKDGRDGGPDGRDGYGKGGPGGHDSVRCRNEHVVKDGEGLFAIGNQYKVSAQAMLDANPWVREKSNYWLQPGDKLCVP
jgi:hypothetical protein